MIRRLRPLLALMLAGALAVAPAAALGASGAQVALASAAAPQITGSITTATPTVLTAASTLRVTADIVNDADDAVTGSQVHLRVTDAPLTSHEQIADFLDSPESYGRHTVVESSLGGTVGLAGHDDLTLTLAADATTLDLPADAAGVYGVTVTVVGADGAVSVDAMVVTWAPVDLPTLQVAAVATATGTSARAAAVTAAAPLAEVAYLVDPTVNDAQAVASHEIYRVPAGSLDLTSMARDDGAALVDYAVGAANDAAAAVMRTAPLIVPVAVADQATLDAAAGAGAAAVILDRRFDLQGVTGGDDASVVDVPAGDGSIAVIRPDETLSTVLATYRPGTAAAASRLVAEAAVSALAGRDTPLVVSPGQSWVLSDTDASMPLRALLNAPWVEAVPLSAALSAPDRPSASAASASTGTEDDLPTDAIAQLDDALSGVQLIAASSADPTASLQEYASQLLTAASLQSRANTGTRAALIAGAVDTAHDAIDGLSIATSAELNLIAAKGALPITVRNLVDQDVTVVVSATTGSPNLRITGQPTVTIPAGGETVVQIPVSAVSTANVKVRVVLRAETGENLSAPQTLTVRVRADWGNAATLVFSILLALLLIAGVIRTVRRGRRDTRLSPDEFTSLPDGSMVSDASDSASGAPEDDEPSDDADPAAPVDEDAIGGEPRDNA
ncbi:DUF6049 family protein [Demequina capsici]|uniref:DUF6049 family protein n=1 Tax=Demequina capsici TaxID=3075620 RepID=A0AA96FDA7_9MICO|nr:DUF6049 family protein [Demequina sp. PMTSA13]WNM27307.1 DUF6049 family protein [Demequina sp. PMTSA13]